MKRFAFGALALTSGIALAMPVFAQNTTTSNQPKMQRSTTVHKQRTDGADPTSQYNFQAGSGSYSARSAQKQRTDGEDVTGNNNFPAASK